MYVLNRNMKNIRIFLPKHFLFLIGKFSVYLNWRVFVMDSLDKNFLQDSHSEAQTLRMVL